MTEANTEPTIEIESTLIDLVAPVWQQTKDT
jgi:hypothetical protein